MFLDDVVGPMSVKEAKRLSGADKFRKHISDIEKKYKPSEEHYNRLKSDPAYREKEFQKWQQEVHGDKAVDEDSWHAGDGGTWGQGDAWSSEQHEMVEGRLHVGDPIVVTAPNEFEGKTGEIAEFSPSGKFAIVDLYNYGRHSMHLSDVEYNQYADREDEGVEEGFQDFNKVEPYAVCLAGKPIKQFDYYEQARQFHDNWKKKLYNSGNPDDKAKADKITLMPIMKEAGSPAQQAAIAINMKKHHKKPKTESDDFDDGDWADDPTAHAVTKSNQPGRYPEAVLRAIERNPAMRADIIADYNRKQQQGVAEAEGDPEGLPHLTKELLTHIVQQVGTEGAHAIIKSLEWGDGAAEELLALILKDLKADISDEEIAEHIGKVKGGYRLYSHKGKNLGTFGSKAAAEKHEREVQYFKHAGESVEESLSDIDIMRQDLESMNDRQFMTAYGISKAAFQQKYRTLLKPAPQQDVPGESVEEGHADQVKRVVKQGGKPVGEIGIDPEASSGNGPWYVKHYASGYDVVGFDSPEEALEELKYCMTQGVAEAAKHGLYYNVNKRKKAGTSRPASSPKAPTAQAWKDAAKTAKKEAVEEEKKRALYHKTQDAPTKQAIDKAYRANPSAKNDTEALASLLSREIDSIEQEKELNQDQEQRIKDLDTVVSKIGGQAPAAAPTATAPSTPGPVSTPMPTPRPVPTAPAPSSSDVVPMPGANAPTPALAKTTVAPTGVSIPTTAMPSASVQRPATKPAATPAVQPTAQTAPVQAKAPAQAPATTTVQTPVPQAQDTKDIEQNLAQKFGTFSSNMPKLAPSTGPKKTNINTLKPRGADAKAARLASTLGGGQAKAANGASLHEADDAGMLAFAQSNLQKLTNAYVANHPSVEIDGLGGIRPLIIKKKHIRGLVDVLDSMPDGENKRTLMINLFTNPAYLGQFIYEYVVNKGQNATQPDPNQGMIEGEVVPFTNNQQTLQAYNDAMQIVKSAADTSIPDARVNAMRQNFASKYQQRYQIAQAPDRTYYLLDKQTNQRQRLPDPRTFAIENTDYWNKLQNERSKKLNRLVNELKESIK
jgi:hypothetical protein